MITRREKWSSVTEPSYNISLWTVRKRRKFGTINFYMHIFLKYFKVSCRYNSTPLHALAWSPKNKDILWHDHMIFWRNLSLIPYNAWRKSTSYPPDHLQNAPCSFLMTPNPVKIYVLHLVVLFKLLIYKVPLTLVFFFFMTFLRIQDNLLENS